MRALSIRHESRNRSGRLAVVSAVLLYSVVSIWHTRRAADACRRGPFPRPEPLKIHPSESPAGVGFNVQADGSSAIAVEGTCFTIAHSIYWGAIRLETVWRDPGTMTALVPKRLVAHPDAVTISVRDFHRPDRPEMLGTLRLTPGGGEGR